VVAPTVSVVVPARNAAGSLPGCLEALAAQSLPVAREVIVVDDGSTDATAAIAAGHPSVRVVSGPGRGSYAARNAGAAAAAGAVLAFTDADCMPSPGWLAAGIAALDDLPADLIGGRITWVSGPAGVVARYDRATYLQQEQFVAEQGFAATANLFARAEVFDSLGGFDGSLRSGGDYEFCHRAVAAGFRLGFAGEAVVNHRPRTTLTELWHLHRRLGAGWADLHRRGLRPPWWRDEALRMPTLGMVASGLAADPLGPPVPRRRQVLLAHAVTRSARAVGRLTGH
jgi:glycosyltransferase involved in cell wall biosynthesis